MATIHTQSNPRGGNAWNLSMTCPAPWWLEMTPHRWLGLNFNYKRKSNGEMGRGFDGACQAAVWTCYIGRGSTQKNDPGNTWPWKGTQPGGNKTKAQQQERLALLLQTPLLILHRPLLWLDSVSGWGGRVLCWLYKLNKRWGWGQRATFTEYCLWGKKWIIHLKLSHLRSSMFA